MPFGSLWLPVVVSAVAVWFLSAILHMVLKYHRADYKQLRDENAAANALRGTAPGVYVIPYCPDPSQMKDPAVQKKYADGPVALITMMRNGMPAMGKILVQWLLLCLLVSFTVAYIARHTLAPGADSLNVLRITGAVAFIAYGFGAFQDSIWRGIPWPNSLRVLFDSLLYALTTGFIFRAFWPEG